MNNKAKSETRLLIIAMLVAFSIVGGSGFWRWRGQQAEWKRAAEESKRESLRQAAREAANQKYALYRKYLEQKEAQREIEVNVRTALIQAARNVNLPMVRQLLKEGYDPNYSEGSTALEALIYHGHNAMPYFDEKNPKKSAQKQQQFMEDLGTIVRLLARHGAKVNARAKGEYNGSPLQQALRGAHEGPRLRPLIVALLRAGANPNEKFGDPENPDSYAGTPLGSVGVDPYERRSEDTDTKELIDNLLRHGARLEGRDWWGRTPLQQSLDGYDGYHPDALYLLKRGAKVNVRDRFKRTPLHTIFGATPQSGMENVDPDFVVNTVEVEPDVVKALLRHGANANARDKKGRMPLHFAIENLKMSVNNGNEWAKNLAAIKLLLRYGADANGRDGVGKTPLIYLSQGFDNDAPYYPRLQVARLLVKYGANPDLRDQKSWTPLMYLLNQASQIANPAYDQALQTMTQFLLENGANPRVPMPDGRKLLDLVPQKQVALRKLLVDWGAK